VLKNQAAKLVIVWVFVLNIFLKNENPSNVLFGGIF